MTLNSLIYFDTKRPLLFAVFIQSGPIIVLSCPILTPCCCSDLIDVTLAAEYAVFVHVCYVDVSIDVDVDVDVAVILINTIGNC